MKYFLTGATGFVGGRLVEITVDEGDEVEGGQIIARLDDSLQQRVRDIGEYRWRDAHGANAKFFDDNEIENLTIARGTLTDSEREVINNHMAVTIKMLAQEFKNSGGNIDL